MKPLLAGSGKLSTPPITPPAQILTTTAHQGGASALREVESRVLAWLPAASLAFMMYSSGTAIYESNGDPGTVAFVGGSLAILGALYLCMREFEKAVAQGVALKKERYKLAIWLLAMGLNTIFSYRVTTVLDSTAFAVVIWAIAGATTVVGCYLMFFHTHATDT